MDFTQGKRRQYERLMKEKPGYARRRTSKKEKQLLHRQAREAECEQKKLDDQTDQEG